MRVRILGSAAGGAFPQWNCACPNCRAVRSGTFRGKARTQTQIAISVDPATWFLLGASPDLRSQIEATPELQPQAIPVAADAFGPPREQSERKDASGPAYSPARQSPIAGAVLLNADLDHVLGLLLLRELQPLRVHATESIRRILSEDNSMFAMLQRVPGQLTWAGFKPRVAFPLLDPSGKDSGIRCRALSLGTHFPAYVSPERRSKLPSGEASLGLMIESPYHKRLAYMPAVPEISEDLIREFESADVLMFDGTFWSDDELIRTQGPGQSARQMGHVPVSSPQGSLSRLAQLRRPRKIYIHINNTNPMLNEAGPEYREVRDAGWELAEDGCHYEL